VKKSSSIGGTEMSENLIYLNVGDSGNIDARGDQIVGRLSSPDNAIYQAITRWAMRDLTIRRGPEFEGYLDESYDHELIDFRSEILKMFQYIWRLYRATEGPRRFQFVEKMEELERAKDKGSEWWRSASKSWLWDEYMSDFFSYR
jgi:hypothetical protein